MTAPHDLAERIERADGPTLRNCDLLDGMDYLEICRFCDGDGEYEQTHTAGCGGGYFHMNGPCGYCGGTGIRTINGGKVSCSHLAQIECRRTAAIRAQVQP